MIIPVKIDEVTGASAKGSKEDGQEKRKGLSVPQWSMVELQGELISKGPLSGQDVGSMSSENVSCGGLLTRFDAVRVGVGCLG